MSEGINAKRKGKEGELQVCRALNEYFGWQAERTVQYSGRGGTGDVYPGFRGLHIEVKWRQKWEIDSWMDQAIRDCPESAMPLVITKRNREPWLAIWLRQHRIRLMRAIEAHTPTYDGLRIPSQLEKRIKQLPYLRGHLWKRCLKTMVEKGEYMVAGWTTPQHKLLEGCQLEDLPILARLKREQHVIDILCTSPDP